MKLAAAITLDGLVRALRWNVHDMAGQLQVSSEPGRGSTFTLYVPSTIRPDSAVVRGEGRARPASVAVQDPVAARAKTEEPLLADDARVVMVTSGLGRISSQPASLVKRLSDPALSLADIERLGMEGRGGYGESKAVLGAMARLFAAELRPRGILVNATSPGWARTDMGGPGAPRSVEQGAASVLWGVRLPAGGPSGGVFEDGKAIE